MKNLRTSAICSLLFASAVFAKPDSKTIFPVKIDPAVVDDSPYRYNGVVLTQDARGSGFCAWNQRTFFTAAHVVYGELGWGTAPIWNPTANSTVLDPSREIQSRGYYRFNSYAEIVDAQGSPAAFGKDVVLAFAFKDLIPGPPADLNFTGGTDLRGSGSKLITGYPAIEAYTNTETDGYFMHQTGPFNIPFSPHSDGSLIALAVTTGPGNSGGPVWTKNAGKGWSVGGILVGGLPSETVVYTISRDLDALTRSVQPVLLKETPFPVHGVSFSNLFFPYTQSQTIPDGTENWSNFLVGVRGFGEGALITSVKLSLTIKTTHVGDLQVYLIGPGGYTALIHNEEGAGDNDLILRNMDLTASFVGIDPYGKWAVRVRDRLKGDIATLVSYRLEVAAGTSAVPVP